ncbi:MAG: hypothetical protein WCP89_02530 [archaeon]
MDFYISPPLLKKLKDLSQKSHIHYTEIIKKINEITSAFSHKHYKSIKNLKKAHIGDTTLIFEIQEGMIKIHDIEEHSVMHKKLHY